MFFKAKRYLTAALVLSLLIQMQLAENGYAARGTKIAFTCWRDGNHEICVMDGDGGNEVRLTDNPDRDYQPAWSPDGTRIAFTRGHHLYVMDSDGQNLMELTKNTSGWKAAWSPDGAKIAYTRFKALKRQVWVMDSDGQNSVQLTEWGENYDPAWSPDGNRIAFVSAKRHGGPEIYVMDSGGDNQVRLTHDLKEKENPSWSPDGKWIVYDAHRGWAFQVYVVETDGGGFTRRISRDPPNNSNPAWSPDGNTIAYVAWGLVNSTINLMTPEGKHLEQLTEDGFYSADPDWFDPVGRSVSPATNFVTIWGKIKAPSAARR